VKSLALGILIGALIVHQVFLHYRVYQVYRLIELQRDIIMVQSQMTNDALNEMRYLGMTHQDDAKKYLTH